MAIFRIFCTATLTLFAVENIHDTPTEVCKATESVAYTFQCLNRCVAALGESIVIAGTDPVPDFLFSLLGRL